MSTYPHLRSKWQEGAIRPVPNEREGELPGLRPVEVHRDGQKLRGV
jgi:hypothetical protein